MGIYPTRNAWSGAAGTKARDAAVRTAVGVRQG